MSNNDIDLTWDASEFIASCVKFRTKFEASVLILCQIAAMKMEEYAKNEAPWTDRTGNARQNLKGQAEWISADKIMIAVSHHMSYGYWLELAHGREYAILEESIEENVEELYRALRRLLK